MTENLNPDAKEVGYLPISGIDIEIPRDKRGRIRWQLLEQEPQHLLDAIENEALKFLSTGRSLTRKNFCDTGMSGLDFAVRKYYPGGIAALREKVNDNFQRRARGYWQDLDNIRHEAQKFCEIDGSFTYQTLLEQNAHDLAAAILKYYPRGVPGLKQDLGVSLSEKPKNYWTAAKIKEEAEAFYREHGEISQSALKRNGRHDLLSALGKNYEGGWAKIRADLGTDLVRKPKDYWDSGTIENEAAAFFQQFHELRSGALNKQQRSDLSNAIKHHYPGGIRALREKLCIKEVLKPRGYWTREKIEQEALNFYQQLGQLSHKLLIKNGRGDLASAIRGTYKGGMMVLKGKLNIEKSGFSSHAEFTSEEAGEQLNKLLGDR